MLKNGVGRYNTFFQFLHKACESSFLCRFRIESVNVFVFLRFDLCHVFSSSTNNFTHAQTLSRMSSLSGRMNIARVNIGFFTGFKNLGPCHHLNSETVIDTEKVKSWKMLHFSRYLPPEQRPMVTAVSTRLCQLCGTTYHSSSKL